MVVSLKRDPNMKEVDSYTGTLFTVGAFVKLIEHIIRKYMSSDCLDAIVFLRYYLMFFSYFVCRGFITGKDDI